MSKSAVATFERLVNRVAAFHYDDEDRGRSANLLSEIQHVIELQFGEDSEYLNELNRIKLYRSNAKKGNREEYFLRDKSLLTSLLNKILHELNLGGSSQKLSIENDIFGDASDDEAYKADIFMAMPFAPDFDEIYEYHIKRAVIDSGYSIKRGDDFFSKRSIISDVWSGINAAEVIIAECTGRNPNVFYELGIAHALNKATIMLAQDIDDVPFDIRHLRVIVYENSIPSRDSLEKRLVEALEIFLGKRM